MNVIANVRLNNKFLATPTDIDIKTIASGWVEIDETIKFPVHVRRYTDKASGNEKMFVSYPQRKKNDGTYDDVVRPASKEIRNLVEETVLKATRHEIAKDFIFPEISSVRVSLLPEEKQTGNIKVKAVCSLCINGFYVSGITVKEGMHGLFVQMPQYQDKGEFKDTVYGITSMVQNFIRDNVLHEYNKKLAEPTKEPEQTVFPTVVIKNLNFEEQGYLKFNIETAGKLLEGRFRIYDKASDENMKLVHIEDADKYEHLNVLWYSIEEELKVKMEARYNALKEEASNDTLIEENAPDQVETSPKM